MKPASNTQMLAAGAAIAATILMASGFLEGFGNLRNLQASVPAALLAIFLLLWDRFSRD